jgi:acyl-CoA synthetase (AMP-forming)/AMP-acid ligase II
VSAQNVADAIGEHARTRPGAPAVVTPGRALDYREFDAAISRAAAWLAARGIAAGQVVGVTLANGPEHLVAAFALARMGAVQLSLPMRESLAWRTALAARFRARAIVGAGEHARLPGLDFVSPDRSWLEGGSGRQGATERFPGGDAPWKIVLTSGTTGAPKAVLQTHAMHLAWRAICQAAIPALPEDRYLAVVGLDFHAGFLRCANVLHAGGAVLLGFPLERASGVMDTIERESVSHLALPPPQLHYLLAVPGDHRARLRRVRILRTGAMTVPASLCDEVRARLTPHLLIAYGTNDGGTPIAVATGATLDRHPGSVGFASPGVEIEIVDGEDRALPAGEVGSVRVHAPGVPSGYLDDPAASGLVYRDGWYYPGDLGTLSPDGALILKGRADERITYDGIKIYPAEIESVVLEHPAIADAAAFGVPSEMHQEIPAIAVVLRAPMDGRALRAFCAERLGVRAPRLLFVLKELPRNARGKVLRRELAALALRSPK